MFFTAYGLVRKVLARRTTTPHHCRQRRFRPLLEALETRLAPAIALSGIPQNQAFTATVATFNDLTDPQAQIQANIKRPSQA